MRKKIQINLKDVQEFKEKLISWANQFSPFLYLDSNDYYNESSDKFHYNSYNTIVGIDRIAEIKGSDNIDNFTLLKSFLNKTNDWAFGHFSYDLKNEIENLKSENIDHIQFPELYFFIPKYIFTINQSKLEVLYEDDLSDKNDIKNIINEIENNSISKGSIAKEIIPKSRISKKEYINLVKKILDHIHYGDVYEINFCNEFFAENTEIDAVEAYLNLKKISPTPFSGFYKVDGKYLISASPERFIKKTGNKVISQPIKGTIQRGKDESEDLALSEFLKRNRKERAENTMIVDLVRNDLSKHAKKGSVKVEEYCGIYSFSHVHQMISTISAEVHNNVHPVDIIKDAFPMGSMTGAPKVKAMKLIEKYEKTKRGLFSGSVGYFTPEKNFDFNVIIRSILYNEVKKYLNFIVGSAITANSIPEHEYKECLIKAKAMQESLLINY